MQAPQHGGRGMMGPKETTGVTSLSECHPGTSCPRKSDLIPTLSSQAGWGLTNRCQCCGEGAYQRGTSSKDVF